MLSDRVKLWIGYVFGILVFVGCLIISWRDGTNAPLHILLCLLGGVIGWTVGILATPFDEDERTKFSDIAKGVLALGSGYVVGKLEGPIVIAATDMVQKNGFLFSTRISLFGTCDAPVW
jgi:hypothetical protein